MSQLSLVAPTGRAFIVNANCLEWLKRVPDNTFDSCVTDPPYEIAILGHSWDATGIAHSVDVWREVYRVLKPGARLIAFAAPQTYHRLVCSIEDAGFKINDMIPWLKGGANMPKGERVSVAIDKALKVARKVVGTRMLYGTAALSIKERGGTHSVGVDSRGKKKEVEITENGSPESERWDGWRWNLKPGHEPAVLARKPPEGSAVASLLKWGTGALNLAACSVQRGPGNTSLPANVLLTPESAEELGDQSGPTKCASNKKPTRQCGKAFHGNGKPQVWAAEALNKGDTGTAARYFHHFKWCRKANNVEKVLPDGTRPPETLVSLKPEPLIEWLIKLVTPPGGKCLDPFVGGGTALICAERLGVDVYGIELNPEHYEFAQKKSNALHWELPE